MKRILPFTAVLVITFTMIACNSAKKAEAERKRNDEKMEQLEKDKRQFEQQNK